MTHGDDCVGDLNGDGHLDVLLNIHTDQWQLLYGTANGNFTPAPTQFSPPTATAACSLISMATAARYLLRDR